MLMHVVSMMHLVHLVLGRHATTRVHAVVEVWWLLHTAALRARTCGHVQGLGILSNDTAAATERADEA